MLLRNICTYRANRHNLQDNNIYIHDNGSLQSHVEHFNDAVVGIPTTVQDIGFVDL